MASSGSIAFPAAWGQLTITVTRSTTTYDASGAAVQQVISGDAVDAQGTKRGHIEILYTFATGQVTTMNGQTVILTATGPQQTTIANAATLNVTIMTAAISAAAPTIIVN